MEPESIDKPVIVAVALKKVTQNAAALQTETVGSAKWRRRA